MITHGGARFLPILLLTVLLSGCMTYWPRTPPQPGTGTTIPGQVRVTRSDGSSVMMVDVRVEGDSLRGRRDGPWEQEVAVALADVKRVEVREKNVKATVALVLVSALGALFAFGVYAYVTTTT